MTERAWVYKIYSEMAPSLRPKGWPGDFRLEPAVAHLEPGTKLPADYEVIPFPPEIDHRMQLDPPKVGRGFVRGFAVVYNTTTRVLLDVYQLFPFSDPPTERSLARR